jgi:predicted GIY-YIG superfamily endonuclease
MDRRHVCNDGVLMRLCVYILASQRNGTLYVGVTNHIARHVWEHKGGNGRGLHEAVPGA